MSDELERAGDALMAAARSLAYAWETESPDRVMWDEWAKVQPATQAWLEARRDEDAAAPVDWPARFRAAAEAADGTYLGGQLQVSAHYLESAPPAVVEAIERALLGEAP